jgi:hypothetical protein
MKHIVDSIINAQAPKMKYLPDGIKVIHLSKLVYDKFKIDLEWLSGQKMANDQKITYHGIEVKRIPDLGEYVVYASIQLK